MAAYRCVFQGHQHALLRSQPHPGEPGSSLCVETSLRGVCLHMGSSLLPTDCSVCARFKDFWSAAQVTRKWLNWEGEAVAQHFAALFAQMEADPRVQRALR